ncbi:hypothetical protein GUITHDRAFT_140808 [Guillardia theta CCMP2712]|uniref:Cyclin-F n=1 Tax=Guillardia theta (strain CCMP2712) TaxID=905079 RepID=L1J337_GUITC|nr:hypothetical protein GUITHDRAFT_140808 [Guillardia theta CCMP2712]EKX42938.1 hypothetical protein GUITHDRAFT_140808 [Guillardia theta CCMP2712]|eukprot:XP_005829918.1 hypothetical protein GUITHDRAFT_140808 [Guillardia theta CCMP2712]
MEEDMNLLNIRSDRNPMVVAKQTDTSSPARRALHPVKVNVMQRIRSFLGDSSAPGSASKKVSSAKKERGSSAKKQCPARNYDALPSIDLQIFYDDVPQPARSIERNICLSEDIMALVMKFMDMNTALNARLVCKSWKKLVSDANLQPLEANLKGEELQTGLDAQSLLLTNRRLENNIWTQSHACSMRTHLSRQETVTEEMRTVLVNWLIEVHFKFRYREPCLHLTIQLLDRFLARRVVPRRRYQTAGVTAFLLGCKFEERQNPHVGDLSYITEYSSTRQNIVDMEREMLLQLGFDLVQPKPSCFLERFSKAAGLETTQRIDGKMSVSHSITLFFIDVSFLDYTCCGTKPSLIAAAAIMCTLRVLNRSEWTEKLAYYTGYSRYEVKMIADKLEDRAGRPLSSAMQLKYG